MRGKFSLALLAVVVAAGCKQKSASPDAGMGAGAAPADSVTNPSTPMSQVPPPDSAPGDVADSAATPSSITPSKSDTVSDSTKKKPSTSSSAAPAKLPGKTTAAAPSVGTTSAGAGATASANSGTEMRDAYHTAPLDTVDGKTYQGWKYFNLNCARCHGEDVSGTTIAPHLIVSLKPNGPIPNEAIFTKTVCEGRVDKGMPAWCQAGLTKEQIDTIYSYVKGRSDAKLHPGRPARTGG